MGSWGAYIDAVGERQAIGRNAADQQSGDLTNAQNYNNFTKMNPV